MAAAIEDEFEAAIGRVHALAIAYDGPLQREFAELAKRSTRQSRGEAERRESAGEDEVERGDSKEQFTEVISYLFSLAFPPTQATADSVFRHLSETLKQPINDVQIVAAGRVFRLKPQLRAGISRRHHKIYAFFRDFLPEEDSLGA